MHSRDGGSKGQVPKLRTLTMHRQHSGYGGSKGQVPMRTLTMHSGDGGSKGQVTKLRTLTIHSGDELNTIIKELIKQDNHLL